VVRLAGTDPAGQVELFAGWSAAASSGAFRVLRYRNLGRCTLGLRVGENLQA
jgi:hypothetical protein